jgi:hypothetical protein
MNPAKSFTTHPSIKRDEFKPVEVKDADGKRGWKYRKLRWHKDGDWHDFVLLKVEDGPNGSFLLRTIFPEVRPAANPFAESNKAKTVWIGCTEAPLDQATVHKIARRPSGDESEDYDFVINEATPE